MLETLSSNIVKANKEHICMWCGGKIHKGETYDRASMKYEGVPYTWKNHLKCSKLCSELNMENDGDGITDECFMEYVSEYLSSNLSEYESENTCFYGEKAVDRAIEILKEKKNK